ncbi:MAG: bifunctional riboflavin kinase/FMN adenylyltransferase, partial [Acidimicrobiia bacterium]
MEVLRDLSSVSADPTTGSAVTIGAFDGVHLGHRAVFRRLREEATPRGLRAALVTFDRHPAEIVRPASAPCRLTDLDQKLELLEECGDLDLVAVLDFDENRRGESAEAFVEEVLVAALRARLVVVGRDFHFGHERKGNVSLLTDMGEALGFEVIGLDLVRPETGEDGGGVPVSSTLVRRLIAGGEVGEAALLLGRAHELCGTVVSGLRRGRELGFPTANVAVAPGACSPREGVYAGTLRAADGVERA